jgi:hypothetical protein
MKAIAILVVMALGTHLAAAAAARRKPATAHPYRRQYVHETFGKRALLGVGARAGVAKAWHGGSFGHHLGRGMTGHVVNNSIEYPIAAARHEDLRYHRSRQRGVAPRLRHALVSTVVTRKTNTGKKTVAAGRISGAMGSAAVLGAPATGGITLGAAAGVNVAREFWPNKNHHRRR